MKKIKIVFKLFSLLVLLMLSSCLESESLELSKEQRVLQLYKPELLNSIDLFSEKAIETDCGIIYSYKLKIDGESYLFKDYNEDYSIIKIFQNKISYENLTSENDLVHNKI